MAAARVSPALAARIRAAMAEGRLRGVARPSGIDAERSATREPRKRARALYGPPLPGDRYPNGRPRTSKSPIVDALVAEIVAAGLPEPVWAGSPGGEIKPIPGRGYKLDLAWLSIRLGWEVDGGAWIGGRHSRGAGMMTDAEKVSLLAGLGWRVGRTVGVKARGRGQLARAQPGTLDWIRAAINFGNEPPRAV